jgi:heme-degrading monooxygenase HmoA
MLVLIWEYEVKPEHDADFRAAYGADGDWVRLFRSAKGYLGTELLASSDSEGRYTTIDKWESRAAWDTFKREFAVAYHRLDLRCAAWMAIETSFGAYEPIAKTGPAPGVAAP